VEIELGWRPAWSLDLYQQQAVANSQQLEPATAIPLICSREVRW
jgi:hypothetical protein